MTTKLSNLLNTRVLPAWLAGGFYIIAVIACGCQDAGKWMKCPAGLSGSDCSKGSIKELNYQDAVNYCNKLSLDGANDWRLPSVAELESLVDVNKFSPAIDKDSYPGTPPKAFWTYSLYVAAAGAAWAVDFSSGISYRNDMNFLDPVRCIRGESLDMGPWKASVAAGARVVDDQSTGLTWQGCPAGLSGDSCQQGSAAKYPWQQAVSYCDGLIWGGHDDWRLPDYHELLSIVDFRKFNPAIDSVAFPATPLDGFWTSSPFINVAGHAWVVKFDFGYVNNDDKTFAYYVRCVRG